MTRLGYILVSTLGALAVGAPTFVPAAPKLIWNASASAPIGLYSVQRAGHLAVSDFVAVMPPEPLARMLDQRGYLPLGVPLIKRVVALPPQSVCRHGLQITVDGIEMAEAQERDRLGRALPAWEGCRRIGDGDIFLLNWRHPDSLDGRYFGPLPQSTIIGRVVPLLTEETGTGQFEWRASAARAHRSGNSNSIPTTQNDTER
ncbi:S26 family signal peptidase [Rhizobium sp. L1K21]|uniref:S26 family signal peptidase n=1 Tax=Rhizobium sp. L1K21 TaxID=2954933 RepID=UPI0020923EFB|nr:S26 family signal peptidase [Rhizobium sp. L1K21]MCO6185189.1 S26 family signal peptidase [Rhizobium sp. L1K21]